MEVQRATVRGVPEPGDRVHVPVPEPAAQHRGADGAEGARERRAAVGVEVGLEEGEQVVRGGADRAGRPETARVEGGQRARAVLAVADGVEPVGVGGVRGGVLEVEGIEQMVGEQVVPVGAGGRAEGVAEDGDAEVGVAPAGAGAGAGAMAQEGVDDAGVRVAAVGVGAPGGQGAGVEVGGERGQSGRVGHQVGERDGRGSWRAAAAEEGGGGFAPGEPAAVHQVGEEQSGVRLGGRADLVAQPVAGAARRGAGPAGDHGAAAVAGEREDGVGGVGGGDGLGQSLRPTALVVHGVRGGLVLRAGRRAGPGGAAPGRHEGAPASSVRAREVARTEANAATRVEW